MLRTKCSKILQYRSHILYCEYMHQRDKKRWCIKQNNRGVKLHESKRTRGLWAGSPALCRVYAALYGPTEPCGAQQQNAGVHWTAAVPARAVNSRKAEIAEVPLAGTAMMFVFWTDKVRSLLYETISKTALPGLTAGGAAVCLVHVISCGRAAQYSSGSP